MQLPFITNYYSQLQIYPFFLCLKSELGPLNICTLFAGMILNFVGRGHQRNSEGKTSILTPRVLLWIGSCTAVSLEFSFFSTWGLQLRAASKTSGGFAKSSEIWHILWTARPEPQRAEFQQVLPGQCPRFLWHPLSKAMPFPLRSGSQVWGVVQEGLLYECSFSA